MSRILASDVAIVIVTRMGQDKPGVLQDWLGSTNRARAGGIALNFQPIVKKTWISGKTYKRGQNGDTKKASTGTKRGQFGDKTGTLGDIWTMFLGALMS